MLQTKNGIEYNWHFDEKSGTFVTIYPDRRKHSDHDIDIAYKLLNDLHSKLHLQVRWCDGDIVEPPQKIPEFIIIQQLERKVGKLESYIQELEFKIGRIEEEARNIKTRDQKDIDRLEDLKTENKKLKAETIKLKQSISELVYKNNQLKTAREGIL